MTEPTIHVLVVDDDEDDFILVRDMIAEGSEATFAVDWVSDYGAALERLCLGAYDICLMDYYLGEKSGLKLLRAARERGCKTPVIMLTGQGNRDVDMAAMEAGAADYLDKSHLSENILERAIRYAMERKQAEEALKESEERLRAITDTAGDAIILLDEEGRISFWNPAATKIFGYTRDEAMGQDLHTLFAPKENHAAFVTWFRKFQETGKGPAIGNTLEFEAIRKDGEQFPIEVSIAAIDFGGKWHAAGIVRDISKRKRMAQELVRTKKFESLSILSGGIAHDYNNILSAVMGGIDLAMMDAQPGSGLYDYLKQARKASLEAAKLTKRFLHMSNGSVPFMRPASLEKFISKTAARCAETCKGRFKIEFSEDLRLAEFDGEQMDTVFMNILINAYESMPQGGTVGIIIQNAELGRENAVFDLEPGRYVKITVKDRGAGIPKENLARVFDPYFSTKEMGSQKGMGLGLTTAYAIVRNHKGGMGMKSEAGVGTTVTVLIPAVQDQNKT